MAEDKYERLPRAGDSEQQLGFETLYLAPKPLPTGQAPFSAQQMHREVNECYLDFAMGKGRAEFAGRVTIGTLIAIVISWLLACLIMAWLLWSHRDVPFFETLTTKFLSNWIVWLIILGATLVFTCIVTYAAYQETRTPPSASTANAAKSAMCPPRAGQSSSLGKK